jgi:hypothetical protein
MKSLFVVMLILSTFVVSAQTKVINLDSIKKVPKTEAQLAENATKTLTVAIYKANKYPVYQTANGKLFIIVQSLTSKNWYRKYIKWDQLN